MFLSISEIEEVKKYLPKSSILLSKMSLDEDRRQSVSTVDCLNFIEAQRKKKESVSLKRTALYPILDEELYKYFQKQENFAWSSSEIDYIADRTDYDESSPDVKNMIDTILAFFLSGDGAISENIMSRFMLECETYEEKMFFISQLHIEAIHADTYGQAAITFLRTPEQICRLMKAADDIPCVKRKLDVIEKWTLSSAEKYQRYMAFACAEGISFCSLFLPIFWFRPRGKFHSLVTANELIRRDESLHKTFNVVMVLREVSKILSKEPWRRQEIEDNLLLILKDFVDIEDEFVDHILVRPIEDLNAQGMKQIVRIIADGILEDLQLERIYNEINPYTWAEDFCLQEKANFFEVRVAAYTKRSIHEFIDWKSRTGYGMSDADIKAKKYANIDLLFK